MNDNLYYILIISGGLSLVLFAYPLFTWIRSLFDRNEIQKREGFTEPISIIISAYNEEDFIHNKVLTMIDPAEWIPGSELIVVSGGSTDNTHAELGEFHDHPDIRLVLSEKRISKIEAINMAVELSKHDILVFSDVRQTMAKGSIRKLLQNFEDPEVGTVTTSLLDTKHRNRPSIYRWMFYFMALCESKSSSCLNIYGALYAQRKSVFREIPNDIIFDDLYVVVSTLSQHKRLVQEKEAILYDVDFELYYQNERISRLARGLLLMLHHHWGLLKTLPRPTLVRFLLYKYLKLLMPFLFIIMGAISIPYLIQNAPPYILMGSLVAILIAFCSKHFRSFVYLFSRINFFFMTATLSYFLRLDRANTWDKLKVNSKGQKI